MSRTKVQIVKETPKAFLVTDGARQGWIQRRWLRADSTVAEATFARAAQAFAGREAEQEAEREFRNSYHAVRVVREAERAIAAEVVLSDCAHEQFVRRLVWFPKSQVRNGNQVPGWLIRAKLRELEEANSEFGAFVEDMDSFYA